MPELDFFGPQTLSRVDVGDVSVRGLGIAAGIVDIVAATMLNYLPTSQELRPAFRLWLCVRGKRREHRLGAEMYSSARLVASTAASGCRRFEPMRVECRSEIKWQGWKVNP
jgi:hypothetical protein